MTFVVRSDSATALLVLAGVAEAVFLVAMLVCMDFQTRMHWFQFFGFLFILIDDLRYGERSQR